MPNMPSSDKCGLVVLVGAGPGDQALASSAAAYWVSRADVILYDRLAGVGLLSLARSDAEVLCVGKAPGQTGFTQQRINDLLLARCRASKLVVRLKGGDPMLFARGGEEAEALAAAGCRIRIVPGVTAATAAAAAAGIPLTDRRTGATVAFVTGHRAEPAGENAIDWQALAGIDMVVFYMAMANLADVAGRLARAGKDARTPAAVVQSAFAAGQRTVTATLGTIAAATAAAGIRAPAVLLVGQNVEMRQRLAWMEALPLFGQTVLISRPIIRPAARPVAQPVVRAVVRPVVRADGLSSLLAEQGAAVIAAPALAIGPADDFGPLDAALRRLADYDWLVLTSANGVAAVMDRLAELGMDGRSLAGVKIAAIGSATATALHNRFINADLIPVEFTSEALAQAIGEKQNLPGQKLLLARANTATASLPAALRAAGADVAEVAAYTARRCDSLPDEAVDALRQGRVDWIAITSAESAAALAELAGKYRIDLSPFRLAAIGPVTAARMRDLDLPPTAVASPHTAEALVDAIVAATHADKPPDAKA